MSVFKNRFSFFTSIFFLLVAFSCQEKKGIKKSIYHWETNFDLSVDEESFLAENEMDRVYVKYFDLKRNHNDKIIPTAKINFKDTPKQTIVPVVFITTGVFLENGLPLEVDKVQQLAASTYHQILELHPTETITEIQIDCDWMASIKAPYFLFLKTLKKEMGKGILSATIRLYQYKYPDLAGVPPVDKGTLMYYNMGNFRAYEEENSILNNNTGEQYLGFGKYPLPLDFALPNFSWAIQFRYGAFQNITYLDLDDLMDTTVFENKEDKFFRVKKDVFLHGHYLRFGDELRYETCTESDLIKAAGLLANEKNQTETTLLFYDLKPTITHETDKINAVCTAFEQ